MLLRRNGGFTSMEVGGGARGQGNCLVPKRLCVAVEMERPHPQRSLNNGFTEAWAEAWEGTKDAYGHVLLPSDSSGGEGL